MKSALHPLLFHQARLQLMWPVRITPCCAVHEDLTPSPIPTQTLSSINSSRSHLLSLDAVYHRADVAFPVKVRLLQVSQRPIDRSAWFHPPCMRLQAFILPERQDGNWNTHWEQKGGNQAGFGLPSVRQRLLPQERPLEHESLAAGLYFCPGQYNLPPPQSWRLCFSQARLSKQLRTGLHPRPQSPRPGGLSACL